MAARMTSTGRRDPSPELEGGGTLRNEHVEPVDHSGAGSLGRPRCRGGRIRQIDKRLPGTELIKTSSRSEVALMTRSASVTSGGQLPPRREKPSRLGQRRGKGGGRTASADDHRPLEFEPY